MPEHSRILTRRRVLACAPLFALGSAFGVQSQEFDFDVRHFGAKGDGASFDTTAIQKAIDTCVQAGGGTVRLQGGHFLSAPLTLASNINFRIEANAVLLGSPHVEDYPDRPPSYVSRTATEDCRRALLFAEKAENISITGEGVIDGQGYDVPSANFRQPHLKLEKFRPLVILFSECKRVRVSGITLRRSACWMESYLACEDVSIDGISVYNRPDENWNQDGIDIVDSWRVRIVNSHFYSADDAICLKSTTSRGCRDVVISNCVASSRASAIKFGTDSHGGFRNIAINNCAIYDTTRSGIEIACVDGGLVEDVVVDNITMEGVGAPIFLRLGNRGRSQATPVPGKMRRIVISNVIANGTDTIGSSITGLPGHPVEDVTLNNIRIVVPGGGTLEQARRQIPEYPERYPSHDMFAPAGVKWDDYPHTAQLPAYGLYVRHASGVNLHNVRFEAESPDDRPALVFDDVRGVAIHDFDAPATAAQPALISLKEVNEALITDLQPSRETPVLLKVEGASSGIVLANSDLTKVKTPIVQEQGVDAHYVPLSMEHRDNP
ncbi:MAG: glycosyl hydrolase family 28 protein [Terracidiphilus sp.]